MANVQDNIITGRKFRISTNPSADSWDVLSIWRKASDVELADGLTLQNFVNNINSKITGILNNELSTSITTAPTVKLLNDQINSLKSTYSGWC